MLKGKCKLYKVPIVGGINRYYYVKAPNKTIARRITQGEVKPGIKVKGKIVEVKQYERIDIKHQF